MKTRISLPLQMAIGMLLGILAGIAAPAVGFDPAWFKPIGQLFINLIRMVVVPLVIATIIAGAASVGDVSKLGRVASKTLIYYFATTAIAVTIGLILANLVAPGEGLNLAKDGLQAKAASSPKLVDVFLNIVPLNPVDSMSKGNMLQVIFFAMLFGFGLSAVGERGKTVLSFFDGCGEVMIKVTNIVMIYAPIGVFGLIAFTVASHGLAVLLPLVKVIGVVYVACIFHVLICYIPLIRVCGLSPATFLRMISAPVMIAFTTCSSAAALSTNLIQVQKLGASKPVSSFSIPLGNTINMDGTAVYMGVVAVFVAELYGIPLPLDKQFEVILVGVLASIGTVGVPGAGLLMSTIVFTQVGIPLEGIAIVAGIDRILDMCRTSVNVLGDATGAIVVSRWEGDFDPAKGALFAEEEEKR
ncbi:dicarboxylate/amino acid:cation symporter [uncultured Mailhella sp.]|uniref:dicarboxylate/amino acid:cation symporter n=1 Tax=uncultured Mailhella sp. TaxID=1981031 RepID=UPI0026257467|nr:dicarboxylate/amino acid:cation symporter [uncultured Mailhella sp.]